MDSQPGRLTSAEEEGEEGVEGEEEEGTEEEGTEEEEEEEEEGEEEEEEEEEDELSTSSCVPAGACCANNSMKFATAASGN